MRLYYLDDLKYDRKYCFVTGASLHDTQLMRGGDVLAAMREFDDEVLEYKMDEEKGGLLVGDCISNHDLHLLLTKKCAAAILGNFKVGTVQQVPMKIINEKGRIHSEDVVAFHLVETVDCLDWASSQIDNDDTYPSVQIFGKWFLKASAVPPDLDLMRVKGAMNYIFSERLVEFIKKSGFTNFPFGEVVLS